MITELVEEFAFVIEAARILSSEYFFYNRETKKFKTDHRLSTRVLIAVRIIVLSFVVYLSLPSFSEQINLTLFFQTLESVTIYTLAVILFVVNYNCQVFTVKTLEALVDIERLLSGVNAPLSKNFEKSLKRLVLAIAFAFTVALVSGFFFYVCNGVGVFDWLAYLVVAVALVAFYKLLSFVVVFLCIWYCFLAVNRCLEGAKYPVRFCVFCKFGEYGGVVVAKEKLCERHLIMLIQYQKSVKSIKNARQTFRTLRRIHKKLRDTCCLWSNAVGIPVMIVFAVTFVQSIDVILMEFQAIRGVLEFSGLVRLSLNFVNVLFNGFLNVAFTHCAVMTQKAVPTGWILKKKMFTKKKISVCQDGANFAQTIFAQRKQGSDCGRGGWFFTRDPVETVGVHGERHVSFRLDFDFDGVFVLEESFSKITGFGFLDMARSNHFGGHRHAVHHQFFVT